MRRAQSRQFEAIFLHSPARPSWFKRCHFWGLRNGVLVRSSSSSAGGAFSLLAFGQCKYLPCDLYYSSRSSATNHDIRSGWALRSVAFQIMASLDNC